MFDFICVHLEMLRRDPIAFENDQAYGDGTKARNRAVSMEMNVRAILEARADNDPLIRGSLTSIYVWHYSVSLFDVSMVKVATI